MKRKKSKRWLALLMTIIVVLSCASVVFAGLEKTSDGRYYYRTTNGTWAKNTWMTVNGKKYYFNGNGYAVTGFYTISGKKYFFGNDGVMKKNCWKKNAQGKWYYFGAVGEAVKGWVETKAEDGKYYKHYLDSNCVEVYNWQKIGGYWYYFGSNGRMRKNCWVYTKAGNGNYYYHYLDGSGHEVYGWKKIDGYWYYMDSNGRRLMNQFVETKDSGDGKYYKHYLDSVGHEVYGFRKIGDYYYYFDSKGHMLTGWNKIDGAWYYFDGSGHRASGKQTIEGYICTFDSDGKACTGWVNDHRFYYDDYSMVTNQWVTDDKGTYYLDDEGNRVVGTCWIDDAIYGFDQDGYLAKDKWVKVEGMYGDYPGWVRTDKNGHVKTCGWYKENGKTYYLEDSGRRASGWRKIKDNKVYWSHEMDGYYSAPAYYFDPEDGYMYTGTHEIDGQTFYFDDEGICLNR